jgi:hypothetical protein
MALFNSPLDNVRVASPCSSDWNQMVGDERVRFCQHCNLNVYNLSSMNRREAESLIANAEGRLCVRYYQRRDGTILTNNCPVGLRAVRRRLSRMASAALSAVLSFFAGLGIYAGAFKEKPPVHSNTMGTIALSQEKPATFKERGYGKYEVVVGASIRVPEELTVVEGKMEIPVGKSRRR